MASVLAAGPRLEAQSPATTADAVRGGWVADVDGIRHIFVFKVRDTTVSGIYCAADCSDPSNLAFIDRGVLTPEGMRFQILRIDGNNASRTDVVGRLANGQLSLTLSQRGRPATGPRQLSLQRDPRTPPAVSVEDVFSRRGIQSGPLVISGSSTPYTPPGPNESLAAPTLAGLWVWNTGPSKQHFIFRRVGERILGVVCGPCDNPYSFGVLDNVVIRGDTLSFDINHEDWGLGIEFGPFENHATATLSGHELHLRTVQHNGPRTIEGDLVLIGPLRTTPR